MIFTNVEDIVVLVLVIVLVVVFVLVLLIIFALVFIFIPVPAHGFQLSRVRCALAGGPEEVFGCRGTSLALWPWRRFRCLIGRTASRCVGAPQIF